MRPIRSYVLRQGRTTPAQKRALEELSPKYTVPFKPEPLSPATIFGRAAPLVLEIGSGMGETTAAIAHGVAEPEAAALEFCGGSFGLLVVHEFKFRIPRKNRNNLIGILRPVCRGVQQAAGRELARGERGKDGLHEAPLVVALLWPGIGKEQVDRRERGVGDHVLQNLHRVVADDAQIFQVIFFNAV